jgi:hypothetical protein
MVSEIKHPAQRSVARLNKKLIKKVFLYNFLLTGSPPLPL